MTTELDLVTDNLCILATVGSHAYGLNHAESDIDQLGVFVAPATLVSGLDWGSRDETYTNAGPDGDDLTAHEVGKFLRLCLKGNPTLLELLYVEDYTTQTSVGKGLVLHRDYMLSEKTVRNAYYGFASAQISRMQREEFSKPKMVRHALRLIRQGTELVSTGELTLKVPDPQEYFDFPNLPRESILSTLEKELQTLIESKSVLPEEPDREQISYFLRTIRYEYP